jgi:small subunit ribosomal protein S25e
MSLTINLFFYRLPQDHPVLRSRRRSGRKERVRTMFYGLLGRTLGTIWLKWFIWADLFVSSWCILVKDKANHAVILDKATSDKLYKDVQSYRLITVATLVDRLKINGSLARKALSDLEEKGQIKKVVGHSKLSIYSTSTSMRMRGGGMDFMLMLFFLMWIARAVGGAE